MTSTPGCGMKTSSSLSCETKPAATLEGANLRGCRHDAFTVWPEGSSDPHPAGRR